MSPTWRINCQLGFHLSEEVNSEAERLRYKAGWMVKVLSAPLLVILVHLIGDFMMLLPDYGQVWDLGGSPLRLRAGLSGFKVWLEFPHILLGHNYKVLRYFVYQRLSSLRHYQLDRSRSPWHHSTGSLWNGRIANRLHKYEGSRSAMVYSCRWPWPWWYKSSSVVSLSLRHMSWSQELIWRPWYWNADNVRQHN